MKFGSIMKIWRLAATLVGAMALMGQAAHAQTAADYATYYQYDAMRRPVMKIGPDPDGTSGSLKRRAEQTSYDAEGRVVRVDVGTVDTASISSGTVSYSNFVVSQSTLMRYDAVGNRTQVYAYPGTAAASLVQTSYDASDRPVCSAVRMSAAAFPSLYDATDRPSVCDPNMPGAGPEDRITKTVYDAAGQSLRTIQALGASEQRSYATYSYTANGKSATITDANGNLTTLIYDGFDRLIRQYFPSTTRGGLASNTADYEHYGYDAGGNRTSLRKRDGSTIVYAYDALGRMTSKSGAAVATVNYTYDLAGKPKSATFAASGQGVAYAYYASGRLWTETTFGRTLTYGQDKAGNQTNLYWPDGKGVVSAYDAASNVFWVGDGENFAVGVNRDNLGRISTIGSSNRSSVYGYDAAGRLSSLQHALPSSTASAVTFGFGYNPAGQTVSQTVSNSAYVWTAPAASLAATADGLNRDAAIVAIGGGDCGVSGKGYDCNGNITNDGAGRTFGYDGENRLTTMTGPASASLEYDPLGRLSKSTINGTVTQFLYSGDRLVAEYDGAGALLRRYAHGQGTDVPLVWIEGASVTAAGVRYLTTDRQGSVVGVVDSTGVSVASYSYGPYGEPGDNWGAGSRFRYTGQIALPELKLYHYKVRAYDPARGWFLQTDPIGYGDDLNLYAYTGGDPLNRSDPEGTSWKTKTAGVVAKGVAKLSLGQLKNFAVRQAWKEERRLVRAGGRTRRWTDDEVKELLETGKVSGYDGHHINSANHYPDLAGNPNNIEFLKPGEHTGKGGVHSRAGGTRKPTTGDLVDRTMKGKLPAAEILTMDRVTTMLATGLFGLQVLDKFDPASVLLDPDYDKWQSLDEIKSEISTGAAGCHSSVLKC